MSNAISIDGVILDPSLASVPVMDRGFLYGDSVFEVLRTYRGEPFAVGPHLRRLRGSCDRLEIPFPVAEELLEREMHEVIAVAGNPESYVRIIITRGVSEMGLHLIEGVTPRRIMAALPLPTLPDDLYIVGRELATVTTARSLDGTGAEGAKASNYLPNILSLAKAKARGAYEALSVAAGGEVLEGSTSNVFIVRDGAVLTPPLRIGILGGITREVVIEVARSALGLEVTERLLFPPDVYRADEVFITSSIREVVPIVRVDGVVIADGRPGRLTTRLHQAFRERVGA